MEKRCTIDLNMSNKRVLFLEGNMSRSGGTERMTAWLANSLCEKYSVTIASLSGNGNSFFELSPKVRNIRLPDEHPRMAIRKFIKSENIDIVINVDTGMAIFGIPAAFGLKTKVITWEHSNFCNNWNSRWFPYIRRFAARHSDAVVVLTERDKQNYEQNIRHCKPVTVIHNPVKRCEIDYKIDSEIILSAGHLAPVKRFGLIPEIGKIIFERFPDWKWRICGDGGERGIIERKITEYGMKQNIILAGRVDDMDSEYQNAAIYAMTSEMEGLPMVLLEAKAHGLPIVSFDIMTGPAEIVRDEVNGFLTESGDVQAMAERLMELMGDAERRLEFSRNAAIGIKEFDEEGVFERWVKLFAEITSH